MQINHNLTAMNTLRQLNTASTNQSKSMEKLSSGLRINRAGDDAAGLAVSEKMRGQIRGLDQAAKNAQDGISLIQTAEGALNETHDILQRMRELSVQSGNDTNTDTDRVEMQKEVSQLIDEIDRIGNNTQFNTQDILKTDQTLDINIGSNSGQALSVTWKAQTKSALGEDAIDISTIDIGTKAGAQTALDTLDSAIASVSSSRSKMGAYQNRLEHSINNINTSSENLTSAESRIRDVDYALAA